MTAMSLTALLGSAGLGTEATLWYLAKRNMQGATDAASFTAAVAEAAGQGSTAFTSAANAVAKKYGFIDDTNGVVVTVNNPPKSGSYTTNNQAIEVIIQQPQQLLFSALFLNSQPTISARAVALPGSNGTGCVMALDKGDVTDTTDVGNSTLALNGCSLYINSPSSSALSITGTASINAYSANIVGNYTASNNTQFTTTNGINTGATAAADPYANVPIPSYSGCNQTNYSQNGGTTNVAPASPGGVYVFCGGVNLTSNSTLNLAPGTYIIDGGNFSMAGQTTITGTGVTIILTSSSGSSYGTASIAGGASISISAPTAGATAGLAFFQDRNAPQSGSNSFVGGSSQNITGALYFPNEAVTYTGGASGDGAATCTQLLAETLTFNGTSTFNSNCGGTGVKNIGSSSTVLVE